ncbi:MAG: hypothetical protein AUG96_00210 [Chloroflexi bacterium 13_1_20CM_4_66_15]|nr:MAG: hypothetical protein AUG96_00210 [Chloroflexi bacterium 13_1_20CM_4_66_15]
MRVLVLNAGSSSLKGSIVDSVDLRTIAKDEVSLGVDATRRHGLERTVRGLLRKLQVGGGQEIDAVGHRVVHGGTRYRSATRIDDRVLKGIESLAEFAPLHNRIALLAMHAARKLVPNIPQVAAFDTAFHAGLAPDQFIYPVPWRWYREYGIRRFGFHGLSVEWSTDRAAELLGRPKAEIALIVAHLGSGCSVTAVLDGRSVATSMGLTPMEGLMMGTRSGSIDPGILLYMLRTRRAGWRELEEALDHHSGLTGVYGRAAGMREIEAAARMGNKRAKLAIDMFTGRTAAAIAAATTTLPRLDALVFTGGIGEHSTLIREAVVRRLVPLGLRPHPDPPPQAGEGHADPGGSRTLVVEAREDAVIARQTAALLRSGRGRA